MDFIRSYFFTNEPQGSDAGTGVGGPGGPLAPIFGRSLNPIPTRGGQINPTYTGTPNIFHLPVSLYSMLPPNHTYVLEIALWFVLYWVLIIFIFSFTLNIFSILSKFHSHTTSFYLKLILKLVKDGLKIEIPLCVYFRDFTKFGIKVLWRLQFLEYLRTLSLKFQKARTKIEFVLSLPS